ncbi:hypothetical protein E4T56_gene8183 [Termitomyces sp. T112]|nr:hypothetical protein E4T56_gene8183 [Termitomyces sp. T112]
MLPRCMASSLRLPMRKLTLESASPWMVSEPYRTGKCLTVVLPARSQTTDVQVIKLYPPTNSVTLLVEKLGSSSDIPPHAILKLADRRFGNAQEEFLDEPAWPWTTDIEREFQAGLHAYIQMHDQPPDLSQDEDDEPTWMRELRHWNEFNFVHRQKKKAYSYLKEAQLRGYVPLQRSCFRTTTTVVQSSDCLTVVYIFLIKHHYLRKLITKSLSKVDYT